MPRKEAVNELKLIYGTLLADIVQAEELYRISDTQFSRRVLIRAFFAFIEGLAYNLRQVTLASCEKLPNMSDEERVRLREKTYELDKDGNLRLRTKYLRTGPGFLFSLQMYPKTHGGEYSPKLDNGGWVAFDSALKLRDSITHPKSAATLEISDEAFKVFCKASDWAQTLLLEMFDVCNKADRRILEKLEDTEN